jgi:hypothetical protein
LPDKKVKAINSTKDEGFGFILFVFLSIPPNAWRSYKFEGEGEGKKRGGFRGVCNNSCRLFVDTCKSGGGE